MMDAGTLKRLRNRVGLTQRQLAAKAGLSVAAVVGMEQGRRPNPKLDTLRKLADALGVGLDELASRDPPKARRKEDRK